MTETENQYYKLKREIRYRVRDILRSVDRARDYTGENNDVVLDELASIFHEAEMIEFAFQEAEKAINTDIEKSLNWQAASNG